MPLPRLLNEPGPLLAYISKLHSLGFQREADDARRAVKAVFATPEGLALMDLLEKSTELALLPALSDDRALSVRNAQSLIASDLRRIMSNETERLLEQGSKAGGRAISRSKP